MESKSIENMAVGFLAGAGFDAIMKAVANNYVPQLTKPSPLKLPGYDPAGVHYDDLLVLGTSAGLAGISYARERKDLTVTGLSMALGSYVLSAVLKG